MTHKIPFRSECKHSYLNQNTNEHTTSASVALAWHKNGERVQVNTLNPSGSLRDVSIIEGAPQRDERNENLSHCKNIANDIDDYCGGRAFRCPECGQIINVPDDREKHLCTCGYCDDIDEYEQLTIYDYLTDVFDIEYRIGSDRELRSVQIMIACGGPNIYIDTATKAVELYWWTERASYPLSYNAVNAIEEWAEEYYSI